MAMKTIFVCAILLSVPAANLSAQVAQGVTIGTGTNFSLGGATLSLPSHWANSGTFNAGAGTVVFNGPGDYQLITNADGETFQNLTIDKASSYVLLNGNVIVNGNLTMTKGDLNTNGHAITMGSGAFLSETAGNTVLGSGTITATAILIAPSGTNVCGLGVTLTSAANLGSTIVRRGHTKQIVAGDSSILRYYDIIPTNNTGLNATLIFHYDVSELNGLPDSSLCLYRSTDGGSSWQQKDGTVNIAAKTISLSGIDAFSRWTLARKQAVVTAPDAPALASPSNGAMGVSGTVAFRWHPAARASTYRLQISADTLFTSFVVHDSTLTDTVKQVNQLASGVTYYWRVNATNAGGTGAWSTMRNFTTIATSVDASDIAPTEFALLQNYPNPFNPSTIIRYELPRTAYVKISVYDMLGREVARLADAIQPAARYNIEWRPTGLCGGFYFCRIQASEFSAVRKMIFLK
jgi:hypothetical protein